MTNRQALIWAAALGLLVCVGVRASADVLNFDDITVSDPRNGDPLPIDYHGFNWGDANGNPEFFLETDADYEGPNSFYHNLYGAPSSPNAIANNAGVESVTISRSTPFFFDGADFSSFVGNNVYQPFSTRDVTLTGFLNGQQLGNSDTFRVSDTGYVFTNPNFGGPIDTLQVESAPSSLNDGAFYLLDNFTFHEVPEPASLGLLCLPALLLRRRA